ncbi:hypothetical protein D3C72_1442570 [compost metagenome]
MQLVAVEQPLALGRQAGAVLRQEGWQPGAEALDFTRRRAGVVVHERRLVADHEAAVDRLGRAVGEHARGAAARLLDDREFGRVFGAELQQGLRGEPRVPGLQRVHACEGPHAVAVGLGQLLHGLAPDARLETPVARGHHERGGQPAHVPVEGALQGFVEIVDVEDQRALGAGKEAEVREVRIAAQLRRDAAVRQPGEVVRHQAGGAAVEREGADQHAAVAHRHQLGHAAAVGRL